jgi:hypothetical protein
MMHSFFLHLTAALLAMHTVLGCCWHHDHACGRECKAAAIESVTAHAGHDADHCVPTGSQPCQNHGPRACQGNKCVFLRTVASGTGAAVESDLAPCVCSASGDVPSQTPAALRPLFAGDALLPPLRLHLAHQVLLL